MLKTLDLRNLTQPELEEKVNSLKKELFDLKGQARVGKLEKSSQIRLTRRNIARVKTVMNEKIDLKPAQAQLEGTKDETKKK